MNTDIEQTKWMLEELSNQDGSDIESNEIEIYGEDEQGHEGCFSVTITSIAENALKTIKEIESKKDDLIKDIATEFFYHWFNTSGTNTAQGFDDWWKINKARFISDKA